MARIEYYDFGEIVVDGRTYYRDLIISLKRIISNWWRKEGHKLFLDDLKEVLNEDFEFLVIGTGYYGYMVVMEEVIKYMEERGIKIIVKPTRDAVKEYNNLVTKGTKVVGAFHLTC